MDKKAATCTKTIAIAFTYLILPFTFQKFYFIFYYCNMLILKNNFFKNSIFTLKFFLKKHSNEGKKKTSITGSMKMLPSCHYVYVGSQTNTLHLCKLKLKSYPF